MPALSQGAANKTLRFVPQANLSVLDPVFTTATVTGKAEAQGVDRLLGFDVRPSSGKLIGVTDAHAIVEIDPMTGATTEVAKMDVMLPATDGAVIVDFNPAADKLRFMTGTTNHRVDPDSGKVTVDGALAYQEGDMHAGEAPMIVAGSAFMRCSACSARRRRDRRATRCRAPPRSVARPSTGRCPPARRSTGPHCAPSPFPR